MPNTSPEHAPIGNPGLGVVVVFLAGAVIGVAWNWNNVGSPSEAIFSARTNLVLAGVTTTAVVIALWTALLSRSVAVTAQRQLALQGKEYRERNKPVVFLDLSEEAPQEDEPPPFVVRNVGGGFAVNVFYVSGDGTPVPLGSLPSDGQRLVPPRLRLGWSFLVIAEAPYTRTTQWTPTLNYRHEDYRLGRIEHRLAVVKVPSPTDGWQSLDDFLQANRTDLFKQLTAFVSEYTVDTPDIEAHVQAP
jgi:hypothetical protein